LDDKTDLVSQNCNISSQSDKVTGKLSYKYAIFVVPVPQIITFPP